MSPPPQGSKIDPFEHAIRETLAEWPQIKAPRVTEILRDSYGYEGSVQGHRLHRPRPVGCP